MESTFLYEVRPHRVITGIHGVPYIRSPRSIYLTKEEVLICLEAGHVWRRFANQDKLIRVTKTNLDRLHQEKYVEEDEEVKVEVKPAEEVEAAPIEEEPITEEVEEEAKPADPEPEQVEESPVESSNAEDTGSNEEEAGEEDSADEGVAVDDSAKIEQSNAGAQQQNNVQFKNNRHSKHKK